VARETLAGSGVAANERTVDVQINQLRRKIERDPANPLHLQTAPVAGYRLLVDR
jgi:two-component system phosphate regulon response regulator OmpR